MKYLIALLLFPTFCFASPIGPGDFGNPAKWYSGSNPTPIANTTPVAVVTAVPTATGTPTSQRYYVTSFTAGNSHASVDTDVQLLDGTTVKWVCPAAHGEGGCAITFPNPLRGSANGTWNCKTVTTGASVTCSISGYKSAN